MMRLLHGQYQANPVFVDRPLNDQLDLKIACWLYLNSIQQMIALEEKDIKQS
jgi:hypothetical protein